MSWTIEQVKEDLPEVDININGKILKAKVTGRKLPFASVTVDEQTYEYAWGTIVNALNAKRPLQI